VAIPLCPLVPFLVRHDHPLRPTRVDSSFCCSRKETSWIRAHRDNITITAVTHQPSVATAHSSCHLYRANNSMIIDDISFHDLDIVYCSSRTLNWKLKVLRMLKRGRIGFPPIPFLIVSSFFQRYFPSGRSSMTHSRH
jgi:hypothetical protein